MVDAAQVFEIAIGQPLAREIAGAVKPALAGSKADSG